MSSKAEIRQKFYNNLEILDYMFSDVHVKVMIFFFELP